MPPAAAIELRPVEESFALKDRIYRELRAAILEVDVYADRGASTASTSASSANSSG